MAKFLIALIILVFSPLSLFAQEVEFPQRSVDTAPDFVGEEEAGVRIEARNQLLEVLLQKISVET